MTVDIGRRRTGGVRRVTGRSIVPLIAAPAPRLLVPGPWPRQQHEDGPRHPTPATQAPRLRRVRRARLVRQTEPFLFLAGACALIALLATLYLTEDNRAALMTYEINNLRDQQSTLERSQGDLKLQLEQLESLQRIQGAATGMGMVPVQPTATTYIELPPVVDTVSPPRPLARTQP